MGDVAAPRLPLISLPIMALTISLVLVVACACRSARLASRARWWTGRLNYHVSTLHVVDCRTAGVTLTPRLDKHCRVVAYSRAL